MSQDGEFLAVAAFGSRNVGGHDVIIDAKQESAASTVAVRVDGHDIGEIRFESSYAPVCTWNENLLVLWAANRMAVANLLTSTMRVIDVREFIQAVYLVGSRLYSVNDTYVAHIEYDTGVERLLFDHDEVFVSRSISPGMITATDLRGASYKIPI